MYTLTLTTNYQVLTWTVNTEKEIMKIDTELRKAIPHDQRTITITKDR